MVTLIVVIHVIVCIALVIIVLLQAGRGAEIGAAFGGASHTIFGSSGSGGFLSKLTTGAAIIFMITCLSLSYIAAHRQEASIVESAKKKATSPSAQIPPKSSPDTQGEMPQNQESQAPANPAGQP